MSKNTLFKKGFTAIIIVLFIGVAFVSDKNADTKNFYKKLDLNIGENIDYTNFEFRGEKDSLQPEEWYETFGGNNTDNAECFIQTSNGCYVIVGSTRSYGAGHRDIWLIKTDTNGNELWNQTFGGNEEDVAHCIIEAGDKGYVIVGYARSYGRGMEDVWVIKTDENGNELWNRTFGGGNTEWGKCIIEGHNGYVIIGTTYSFGEGEEDVWMIKTDENGNELWNRTFGGNSVDWGEAVIRTNDEGYIIIGSTSSYGAGLLDVWMIKTDENGNELWNRTFGNCSMDRGQDVILAKDGGFILTGESRPDITVWDDIFLLKTDDKGDMQWSKSYDTPDQDLAYSIIQTDDGSYLIGGTTHSFGAGNFKAWLVKTDGDGDQIWNKTFGKRGREAVNCVIQAVDGSYMLVGDTGSFGAGKEDAWLIKCQDYIPPQIKIIRPRERYFYLFDREMFPFICGTMVFGAITVEVEPYESADRIDRIEFFLDGWDLYETEPRDIVYEFPYKWKWGEPMYIFGLWMITAAGYYGDTGAHVADSVDFWMLKI